MNKKSTNPMVSNRQKKKRLVMRTFAMLFFMALFTQIAQAQNVYMHSGTQTVPGTGSLNFYDSGGPSSPDYCWEKWYSHNENATLTFKNGDSPILVTFNRFTAYDGNTGANLGQFALRVNDDHLYVYEGDKVDNNKLIVDLTGTIEESFSIMAHGPITFKFVSNASYRDEGWAASVSTASTYAVQQPVMMKETCDDVVVLLPTAPNATLYYTTDGSTPTTSSTEYTAPFAIDLDAQTASVTVKAIAVVDTYISATASNTFTHDDQRPTPGVPTISIDGNMVHITPAAVPPGLNETYNVRYTTDGTEPSANNGTLITAPWNPIEWHTPNTTFKAVTVAVSCPDKVSAVVEKQFGNVTVPTPVITFNADGTATIACSLSGASIFYTLDGSTPTTSSADFGTTPVTTTALTPGTTVKAIAHYEGSGYDDSQVASAIYVPAGGSTVSGGVVFLDDREDHTWSYYSDATNPIRSLNPADVKIAYFGNGTGTVTTSTDANPGTGTWTQNATGVQVSANETENQFIYLKTLERVDGTTATNPTGRCEYTTIPNPFSKRPTYGSGNTRYRGFYGWRIKAIRGGKIYSAATGGTQYTAYTSGNLATTNYLNAETTYYFAPDSEKGMEVELEALWARAYVVTSNTSTGLSTDVGYERNFIYLSTNTTLERRGHNGYNVTYTTVDPATGTGTKRTLTFGTYYYNYFYCRGNTKFENAILASRDANTYLDANNHDLVVGRGVTGTVSRVYGHDDGGSSSTMNFTIRLESGTFNNLWLLHNGTNNAITYSNTVSARAILGCDYDRAKNDNGKLSIAPTDTYIEGCDGAASFTSSNNKNNLTFDWNVKSGKIQANTSVNTGDPFYMAVYQNGDNGTQYMGKRRLTMEGGEIGTVAGGCGANGTNYSTYAVNDGGWTVMIRMKGGIVNGSVYGAAVYTGANGDRRMVFTGGTVKGWIAGGCNGTRTDGGDLLGDSYIYFGGKAKCDGSQTTQIGTSTSGNIMGAGSGNSDATGDDATVGRVTNSNIVIADEATVARNVYGGGNYGYVRVGTGNKSDIYVLGGTVSGSVFGGSNQQQGQIVNMWMKDGTIAGSLYGGSNTSGTVKGLATVNVSGGTVTNVFGGGYGSSTNMAAGTAVNVSGGTINNNVYGGGEEGTVTGSTNVTVSGGTMKDVFGAGKGATNQNANITGSTNVTITGGTINNVFGGGENGTVAYNANGANNTNYTSTVNINGGNISENVFGGGKMGTSQVATIVNVTAGNIRGNVFGGAEGEQKKVFVTGMRTVNMTGGHVYGNVYGGSRNANDGNDLDLQDSAFSGSTETGTLCVTNISGGIIDQNVYAAGYYGNTFGSVYVFIGKNAIEKAPYKQPTTGINYKVSTLYIHGTVWAGGDWGTFSGDFGGSTVSGNSNIYVDGTDYETTTTQTSNAQYMNIGGSILGCGTSCDAGKNERTIIIRKYGTAIASGSKAEPFTKASRDLMSIQRAKILILDNASINYNGQGKINSLSATEKYAIYEIANTGSTLNTEDLKYGVRLVNGSSLFLNAPVSQISNFISASCDDVYTAALTAAGYPALAPADLNTTDNKVRVNGGNYVEVKYGTKYCMLSGYAHMMVSTSEADATCAYARPRWITGASFAINNTSYDNRNDGGWVSYTGTKNKVALDGTNPGDPGVQMVYENHTQAKNGEDYYRIWRDGGNEHYREGVFDAHASGSNVFKTVDVTITLPALRAPSYVYRFETIGDLTNTSINYGPDVMTFDAARATGTGDDWISYTTSQTGGQTQAQVQPQLNNGILVNPDVNFGLVVMPNAGAGLQGDTYLISKNADNNLASTTTQFTNNDFTKDNDITFRLTYYDKLTSNMTWEPMTIVLVQVDPTNPSVILDRVTISLAVNTSTTITQEFHTTLYAVMQGKGSNAETYTAKVTLPSFTVVSGQESTFIVNSVSFTPYGIPNNSETPTETGNLISRGGPYTKTDFAVTYGAANNYDNTNGWSSTTGQDHDAYTTNNDPLGTTGGRNEFAIDFSLHYNGHESISTVDTLGVLTYNITFDHFVNDSGATVNNQPLKIKVYVIRRGQGTRFYLDGINGSNLYDGKHPDQAALSLSTIFNRLGYLAGDEIYIVNKVTIDKQTTWNGSAYDNVLIYRYDGGHELATAAGIIGNAENNAYLDTLLNVKHNLVMTGITLDGHYNDGSNQIQVGVDDSNNPIYAPFTPVTAESPMIFIDELAKVELNSGAVLRQNNNNTGNGGAVSVADGGTLMMNADAQITHNVTAGNGGGVYMAGTLNVSDNIQIYDNKKGTAQNNVYLDGADKVVTLGTESSTDAYGALSSSAKIGVTKTTSEEYTKVVHVESESDVVWLDTPYDMHPNTVIFHDANVYQLERYNDPTYLYWVGTWVTTVTWNPYFESREAVGYTNDMTAAQLKDIHTPQQLAWVISMVNGENGCTAQGNLTVNLTADIDMVASIWVPIGTEAHPFTGTFDGQGFMVEGIHSSLVHTNMGTFGTTSGIIQNAMFNVALNANATNMGTVAGTMKGGTISNIEAAGTLTGGSLTQNMGGLVGLTQTGSEVHSSFSVNTMTGVATTVMGGLVGTNGGDLINSYANTSMSTSDHLGGLAGDNTGKIENCYVVAGTGTFPLFANTNSSTGIITYCYADKAGTYIGTDNNATAQPTKSGNYGTVLGYKDYGYMYDDNKVTASGNEYVLAEHAYDANHIVKWDGLLSVLNQWVSAHSGYTSWFRPITQNINGDLPVLGFPKNNSLATLNSDKKFLEYSTNLDQLLEDYSGQTASIFLYGNAANVTKTPGTNTVVYINENAALIQAGSSDFKAVVGVTFDNNFRSATTWNEIIGPQTLTYDWHFLSSPLQAAPLGISYTDEDQHNWWETGDDTQVDQVVGSYFPDHIELAKKADGTTPVGWDIYSFFEPQYHWINLKRNSASHFHYDMNDENIHENIVYTNETTFEPGKGYMMAVETDSYLANSGMLNNKDFTVDLTYQSPEEDEKGCNFLGNPYHAYFNLDAFFKNATNAGNGISSAWVYIAESDDYVPYAKGASSNPLLPSGALHPFQGFFVKVTGDCTAAFTKSMATTEQDNSYFRGSHENYPLVNLFAYNEAGQRDFVVVEFNRPEKGGATKMTAQRRAPFTLTAQDGQDEYTILFNDQNTKRVPIRFATTEDGTYTMQWETYHGTFNKLLLIDNITGTTCDMTTNDHYTFEGRATDFANRFYLVVNATDVDEFDADGDYNNFAYFNGSEWIVNGQGQLDLIDMTGRVLHSEYLAGESNRVSFGNVAAGVYVIRFGNKAQKIVIK